MVASLGVAGSEPARSWMVAPWWVGKRGLRRITAPTLQMPFPLVSTRKSTTAILLTFILAMLSPGHGSGCVQSLALTPPLSLPLRKASE